MCLPLTLSANCPSSAEGESGICLFFQLISSNRHSWRFGVHVSAFPRVSARWRLFCFVWIFISIGHFNGDIEEEELDTCADITFLPRSPRLLFQNKGEAEAEGRKEEGGSRGPGEKGRSICLAPLNNCCQFVYLCELFWTGCPCLDVNEQGFAGEGTRSRKENRYRIADF